MQTENLKLPDFNVALDGISNVRNAIDLYIKSMMDWIHQTELNLIESLRDPTSDVALYSRLDKAIPRIQKAQKVINKWQSEILSVVSQYESAIHQYQEIANQLSFAVDGLNNIQDGKERLRAIQSIKRMVKKIKRHDTTTRQIYTTMIDMLTQTKSGILLGTDVVNPIIAIKTTMSGDILTTARDKLANKLASEIPQIEIDYPNHILYDKLERHLGTAPDMSFMPPPARDPSPLTPLPNNHTNYIFTPPPQFQNYTSAPSFENSEPVFENYIPSPETMRILQKPFTSLYDDIYSQMNVHVNSAPPTPLSTPSPQKSLLRERPNELNSHIDKIEKIVRESEKRIEMQRRLTTMDVDMEMETETTPTPSTIRIQTPHMTLTEHLESTPSTSNTTTEDLITMY